MTRYVYEFTQGSKDQKVLLGDRHDPLLVSVRSGAQFSMPGMMETVLNVGLNDASVKGLAEVSGNERFAWDSYRRLLQMFGKTVLHLPGEVFADAWDKAKATKGVSGNLDLDVEDLKQVVATFKDQIRDHTGAEFPQHPREQLDLAIRAVFQSWNTDRAWLYRRRERISENLGTAVNVCTMVFGNLGESSGTGVAFTRDPATGKAGAYGDYLANAQGEDVVAGIRNTQPPGRSGPAGPGLAPGADPGDASPGDPLPGPVRHRVHDRTGQAVDAADPGGQAHPGGGIPDRRATGRRAADHPGRGVGPGVRRPAGAADVPAIRQERREYAVDHRDGRLSRGCGRPGGLRLADRHGVGGAR